MTSKPWVKTSLAPGSRVVPDYLSAAGLMEPLEALGFHVVGFGCTTCIGNSGPLDPAIDQAIVDGELVVSSVLSGNRNFEGRVHQRRALELPRLAAAGRRLRAGRQHAHRHHQGCARHGPGRQAGVPEGPLADRRRDRRGRLRLRAGRDVPAELRQRLPRTGSVAQPRRAGRLDLPVGRQVDLREAPSVLREHGSGRAADHRRDRCARAPEARRLGHDRPHLARRRLPRRQPRRSVPDRPRRRSPRTSTPTARVAATTR